MKSPSPITIGPDLTVYEGGKPRGVLGHDVPADVLARLTPKDLKSCGDRYTELRPALKMVKLPKPKPAPKIVTKESHGNH